MDGDTARPGESGESSEIALRCRSCGWQCAGEESIGKRCVVGGGELVQVGPWAFEKRRDEAVVEVWRAPDMPQAEIIRTLLESEGIRVAFRSSATWGVHTFTVDGMGEVGILALESEAERVRELIEQCFGETGEEDQPGDDEQPDAEEPS